MVWMAGGRCGGGRVCQIVAAQRSRARNCYNNNNNNTFSNYCYYQQSRRAAVSRSAASTRRRFWNNLASAAASSSSLASFRRGWAASTSRFSTLRMSSSTTTTAKSTATTTEDDAAASYLDTKLTLKRSSLLTEEEGNATATTTTVTASSSSRSPKKKNEWNNNKNKRRKNKSKVQDSYNDYDDNDSSNNNTEIHPGSYAHPEQRALFVPEELWKIVATDTETTTATTITTTSKKKIAVLVGYLGTSYAGFQINAGQRTVQAELEWAAYRAGLIAPSNWGYPTKYAWSTSGRTDKGVHAAAQVVSFKAEWRTPVTTTTAPEQPQENPDECDDTATTTPTRIRHALNALLPTDVRVLDVVRTTRSFCAKTQRDRVRYQYMIPSFCLYPAEELRILWDRVGVNPTTTTTSTATITAATLADTDNDDRQENAKHDDNDDDDEKINRQERAYLQLSPEAVSQLQSILTPYRATPDNLQTLQQCLAMYQGTHSFHNFARKVTSQEARAKRYIESFVVEAPIIINGVEWIPTQVTGQSFMLNQIRKMISLALDVTRGAVPVEFLSYALTTKEPLNISNAPAQGLFLDMSIYHCYNLYKVQQQQPPPRAKNATPTTTATVTPPRLLDELNWHISGTPSNERWREFRDTTILPHVTQQEAVEGNFVSHLFLQEYVFDYRQQYQQQHPSSQSQL